MKGIYPTPSEASVTLRSVRIVGGESGHVYERHVENGLGSSGEQVPITLTVPNARVEPVSVSQRGGEVESRVITAGTTSLERACEKRSELEQTSDQSHVEVSSLEVFVAHDI